MSQQQAERRLNQLANQLMPTDVSPRLQMNPCSASSNSTSMLAGDVAIITGKQLTEFCKVASDRLKQGYFDAQVVARESALRPLNYWQNTALRWWCVTWTRKQRMLWQRPSG